MENKNIEQGKRINGKRANAERYIPFYEFLLFDPLYRKMNEKGKILYTYLRNKVKYFEHENERYEQGEGTKSYLDDEGNTFIIADNTELCYILNCTEPTLIKTKKIIAEYGLLEEVNRKNKSNQIYPLEPKTLSDNWNHIEEIKKNRVEKAESDQQRRKGKKQGETRRKSGDLQNESSGDLKNLSSGDLKNLSSGDLKNLREIESKNHKSNLINLNNESKNQSIQDEQIQILNLPGELKKTLMKNRDRLIDTSVDLQEIELICNAFLQDTPINTLNYILDTTLNNAKGRITNFRNYFSKSITNYYENLYNKQRNSVENESKEIIPEWFKKQKQSKQSAKEENNQAQEAIPSQEEVQEELQNLLNRHISK